MSPMGVGSSRAFRNVCWLGSDKAIRLVAGFATYAYIARYLGADQQGVLNYALAICALLSAVGAISIEHIVIRDLTQGKYSAAEILTTALVVRVGGASIAIALSGALLAYLGSDSAALMALILCVGFVPQASEVADYFYSSQLRSRIAVSCRTFAFVSGVLLRIILVVFEAPVEAFAAAIGFELLLGAVAILLRSPTGLRSLRAWSFNARYGRGLVRESFPLLLAAFATALFMKVDQLSLAHFHGSAELGRYGIAQRLVELTYFLPIAIASSLSAKLSGYSPSDFLLQLKKAIRMAVTGGLLLSALLVAVGWWVIPILFGDSFIASRDVLVMYAWVVPFVYLGVISNLWFVYYRRQRIVLYKAAMTASISVGLAFLLVPIHGSLGAATATVAAYACSALLLNGLFPASRQLFLAQAKAIFWR